MRNLKTTGGTRAVVAVAALTTLLPLGNGAAPSQAQDPEADRPMEAMVATERVTQSPESSPSPGRGESSELMKRVCASARRCSPEMKAQEIVEDLLALPTLRDGRSRRDVVRLDQLRADPAAQLDYALERTLEQLQRAKRYESLSRGQQLDWVAEQLVLEYNSGYWSTLPDDLLWFDRAQKAQPSSSPLQHVAISHFSVDIANSWPNTPTFLLDATLSVQNGPPTHFQMWCDQCESITGSQWRPWDEWNAAVVVTGAGYKNICIEVRAEPYQGNFANTAIACYELGTPPEPEPPTEPIAESNNPVQRCFGAIGNHCGPADEEGLEYGHCVRLHPISDPDTATCQINAGSWRHDECCIEKRIGGNAPADEQGSCSPHLAVLLDQPYVCQAEFNVAVAHIPLGFTWLREVDATVENTTGVVDFAAYCAPTGTVLQFDGVEQFCCSRSGQPWVQHAGDLVGLRWICL